MGITLMRRPIGVNVLLIGMMVILLFIVVYVTVQSSNQLKNQSSVSTVFTQMFKKSNLNQDQDSSLQERLDVMVFQLGQQRALIEALSCKMNGIGARGGFCLNNEIFDVGGNSWWDFKLAVNLENTIFSGQSVGDFGAGLGWYGRFWMRKKDRVFVSHHEVEETWYFNRSEVMEHVKKPKAIEKWRGFDGAGNVEEVTNGLVGYLDLTDEQHLPFKFDWVISLEVGEHIPHIYENVFIDNLIRHACKGIVLSWAVEGQGGHYHINNHNNDIVKKIFKEKGFRNNEEAEKLLRANVIFGYFADTLMVFEREIPYLNSLCDQQTNSTK